MQLDRLLHKTGRLEMTAEAGRAIAVGFALLTAAVLAALLADAVFALPTVLLVALDVLLAGLGLGLLVYLARSIIVHWYDPRRIARLIEQRTKRSDSGLINAVDLIAAPPDDHASATLVEAAIARGDSAAAAIRPREVVSFGHLRKPALILLALAAIAVALLVLTPDLLKTAAARLLDPRGDHPPFTFLQFDVQATPKRIYQGRPATVTARLSGGEGLISLPDEANIVLADPPGHVLPMVHHGDGRFVLQIEKATESFRFYVDTPSGRSPVHTLTVLPAPRIVTATVRYEYPTYTGWPSRTEPLRRRGLRALVGTSAHLRITADLPLSGASLTVHPITGRGEARRIALAPDAADAKVVAGVVPITAGGRYELRIHAANGAEGREIHEGPIVCVPDLPPTLDILEPQPLLVAPVNWTVHVSIHAVDDVGIARLQILRSINGFGPYPIELPVRPAATTDLIAGYDFDLAALGARPGDTITYYASVVDNHPSGSRMADSPTQVIRVISEEQYLQHARRAYRMQHVLDEIGRLQDKLRKLEEAREKLRKKIEKFHKELQESKGPLTDQQLKDLKALEEELKKHVEAIEALARQMQQRAEQRQIYDFEKEYADMLRRRAEQLRKLAEEIKKPKRRLEILTRERKPEKVRLFIPLSDALRALADPEFLHEIGEMLQLTEEEFRKLMKVDALIASGERIVAIAKLQRELADRLGQFRNKEKLSATEQIRARRLAANQRDLARQLAETLERMEKRAADAEADLPKMAASAREIIKKVKSLGILKDQRDAARLAEVGHGRYAHRAAESAAKKLEGLIEDLRDEEGMPLDGLRGAGLDDLDGQLRLTRARLKQCLVQLAQGRGIPGGQGGSGTGYYGSRAPVTLAGPHAGGQGPFGHDDVGRGPIDPTQNTGGPRPKPGEQIDPGQVNPRATVGGGMPGVPIRYRTEAEAYFRRLADESK